MVLPHLSLIYIILNYLITILGFYVQKCNLLNISNLSNN